MGASEKSMLGAMTGAASNLAIPTVDLEALKKQGPEREEALAAIRLGFGNYGLVYVKNHGVGTVDPLYDEFIKVTAQSDEQKQSYNRDDLWYQRGWTPPNTEKAVVAGGQPDFKECWFAAPEELDPKLKLQYPQIYADNVWPSLPSAEDNKKFQDQYMQRGHEIHVAGLRLLEGCAEALGLAQNQFTAACEKGPHVFRLLRYLPLKAEQIGTDILWGEEHTDFNLLTLLPGGRFQDPDNQKCGAPDAGSGLYLRTRPTADAPEGHLVRGTAPAGCIVAQVGQQLEILTGGTFLATPHVITAPKTPGYSRLSAAHFIHLHSHQTLFPLPSFENDESIKSYSPPVLAGTYSIKTLVDIGLAPADALGQLGYRHYGRLAAIRVKDL